MKTRVTIILTLLSFLLAATLCACGSCQDNDAVSLTLTIDEAAEASKAIGTGGEHVVGLRTDGTVVAAGANDYGECDVSDWSGVTAVAAGEFHTVGLRSDGKVVAKGKNDDKQCDTSGWSGIVAVACGDYTTFGVQSNGTVVATGLNDEGQCNVGDWGDIVSVSASVNHTVGLRSDGTVVASGANGDGQCDVSGWSNIVAISAGENRTVGLRADGTVIAVGNDEWDEDKVSDWQDIVWVAGSGGKNRTIIYGLRSDGTLVSTFGWRPEAGWDGIAAIAAGPQSIVALRVDGTVVAHGIDAMEQNSDWRDIGIPDPASVAPTTLEDSEAEAPEIKDNEPDANDVDVKWNETYYVIQDAEGYQYKINLKFTPWVFKGNEDILEAAWNEVGKSNEFPKIDSFKLSPYNDVYRRQVDGYSSAIPKSWFALSSLDEFYYCMGSVTVENVTPGWDITADNTQATSFPLGVQVLGSKVNGANLGSGYQNASVLGRLYASDWTEGIGGIPLYPILKGNTWGPTPFVMIASESFTPNYPNGATIDAMISSKFVYSWNLNIDVIETGTPEGSAVFFGVIDKDGVYHEGE